MMKRMNVPTNVNAVDDVTWISTGGLYTLHADGNGNVMYVGWGDGSGELELGDTLSRTNTQIFSMVWE